MSFEHVSAHFTLLLGRVAAWASTRTRETEDGQSMIEYGLLAGLLSIASVAAAILIGPHLIQMYTAVLNAWRST